EAVARRPLAGARQIQPASLTGPRKWDTFQSQETGARLRTRSRTVRQFRYRSTSSGNGAGGIVSSVGLLYVGAVLFINGLMLLGIVPERAAAAMNLFVGGMQIVFPTIIIAQAEGDPATILG